MVEKKKKIIFKETFSSDEGFIIFHTEIIE